MAYAPSKASPISTTSGTGSSGEAKAMAALSASNQSLLAPKRRTSSRPAWQKE